MGIPVNWRKIAFKGDESNVTNITSLACANAD
jgi:hypothetical protein